MILFFLSLYSLTVFPLETLTFSFPVTVNEARPKSRAGLAVLNSEQDPCTLEIRGSQTQDLTVQDGEIPVPRSHSKVWRPHPLPAHGF